MGDEVLGKLFRGISSVGGDENHLFCKSAYDNEDQVKGSGEGEGFDVVHRDRRPRSFAYGQGLEESIRFVLDEFCPCASVTTMDVGGYVLSESWPEKQPVY